MEDFSFFEGIVPSGFRFGYEIALFNLPEHRLLQCPDGWTSFYILHPKKKIVVAGIHFQISESVASSPYRSPFGSLDASSTLDPKVLFDFILYIESRLRQHKVRKIIIKNPPYTYHPALQILLQTFLLNLQYRVIQAETASIITVDKPFAERSASWEKRKSKQAHNKELQFQCHSISELQKIYDFILACRIQKGYQTSMTLDKLQETANTFPQRFLLTTVDYCGEWVGASISILCLQHVLYHFYSDHPQSRDIINPTVFMVRGLYEYALKNNISQLDLGTSSLATTPNFGLLNFKLRLGAAPVSKLTFEKVLT